MSKDIMEGMLSMDMEHWHSPLILCGVERGRMAAHLCQSCYLADWVHGTLCLWAWRKLQVEAPSLSSRKGSLFGPGYASEEMQHYPHLSHASRLYYCRISWKRCCQSLCAWPHLSSWEELPLGRVAAMGLFACPQMLHWMSG